MVRIVLLALVAMAGVVYGADGQEVRLDGIGEGVTTRLNWGYVQPRIRLGTTRPATLRAEPPGLKHPEYGVLPVGSKTLKRVFHVVTDADEAGGMRKRIWVDTNGDGDLTNDPPVKMWKAEQDEEKGKVDRWYRGAGQVDLGPAGRPFVATLGLMTFDPRGADLTESERHELAYWRDYGRTGRVEIGGTIYRTWLDDFLVTGDFTGGTPAAAAYHGMRRIFFEVDRNGNGRADGEAETFDTDQPFNIGGVTYEIRDMTPSGDFFRIVRSGRNVEERPVAADIAVGKVAPSFVGPGLDGRDVRVPGDFKAKVVLLEFWATWCGPCMAEVPELRDVYAKYRDKGLEIVGVCQDEAEDRQKVVDTVKKERMNWVHIFDGKGEQSDVDLRYGVGGLPAFVLLDGDSGVVLATAMRKEGVGVVVEREMRKKGLLAAGGGGGGK